MESKVRAPIARSSSLEGSAPAPSSFVRILIVWLLMAPLAAFWISQLRPLQSAGFSVLPVVPKAGEPIVATVRLNNPSEPADLTRFDLYVDGELLARGTSEVPAGGAKSIQYARLQQLQGSQRPAFAVHVGSRLGVHELRSLPEYSPQVLSSFVSFAASSTSLMSSLNSMSYYRASFGGSSLFDLGLVLILVMLALSIFTEATQATPPQVSRTLARLQTLAHRFRLVLVSLYIIFGGIAITRLALLFGAIT